MRRQSLLWKVVTLTSMVFVFMIIYSGFFAVAAEQESALHRIQKTGEMRVGWAPWHPWTFIDKGTKELAGIGPDVVREMAQALGVKIKWVADSWGTLVAGLQANKFDLIYPLSTTLSRAKVIEYSDPTQRESINLLINKKDADRFKTNDDLDQPGVKCCAGLGSNVDIVLTRTFKKATIIRLRTEAECLTSLATGKIDATVKSGSGLVASMKAWPNTTVVPGALGYGKNCVAVRQGDQIFLNWINLFISEMRETGVLDRIFEKHGLKREIYF